MTSGGDGWATVRIPKGLKTQVDKFIVTDEKLGYNTTSGFIQDAVRRRLEKVTEE